MMSIINKRKIKYSKLIKKKKQFIAMFIDCYPVQR